MYSIPYLDLPPLGTPPAPCACPAPRASRTACCCWPACSEGRRRWSTCSTRTTPRVMLAALRHPGLHGGAARPPDAHHRCAAGRPSVKPAELFLGNAGTAMRPLTAALALLAAQQAGAASRSAASSACTSARSAIWSTRCASLGCAVDCLGNEGYPPLRRGRRHARALAAPVQVRGDVSSQFLTALLLALPLVALTVPITIEVVGELISKPYIEITLKLLARFGVAGRAPRLAALRHPGRQPLPSAGRGACRGRCVVGVATSSRWVRSPGRRAGARSRASGSASHPGRHPLRRGRTRRMGARGAPPSPTALEIRRGAWPLKAIDLDCNHIPDAAMTLAVMALFADGTDHAAQHRQLARQGNRPHRRDGLPSCASSAPRSRRARTTSGHRARRRLAAGSHPHLRRPPHGHVLLAGRLQAWRGVPVRINDPKCVAKTFPDYFEACLGWSGRHGPDPGDHDRRPRGFGQGHAGQRAWPPAWATTAWIRVRSTASRPCRRCRAGRDAGSHDEAGTPGAPARTTARCASMASASAGGRTRRQRCDPQRRGRHERLAGSRCCRPCARPWSSCRTASARLPGLVADGRDMGTVIFPHAPLKVFLTATAAARAERRLQPIDFKGIFC